MDFAIVVTFATVTALGAKHEHSPDIESFLTKAAEGQQAEIALGQLAVTKASNEQVKQFGLLMVQDHQKASQEVSQLASRDGVKLPNQLSGKAKDKHDTFSKLGGKDFDQAYMTYMLRDHMMDVTEFEEGVKTLQDPAVKQWASGALPVLKEHLQKAKTIARSLGIDDQHAR